MTGFHRHRLNNNKVQDPFSGNTARSYNNFIFDAITPSILTLKHSSILDVGCGYGGLGRKLKGTIEHCEIRLTGLEIEPTKAAVARMFYDQVLEIDAENLGKESSHYIEEADYVVLGDVLEHLKDPWIFLSEYGRKMKAGSRLVMSIPCITSLDTVAGILSGRFSYATDGIFDFTHLRFFGPEDILEMASLSLIDFRVEKIIRNISPESISLLHGIVNQPESKQKIELGEGISLELRKIEKKTLERLVTRGLIILAQKNA